MRFQPAAWLLALAFAAPAAQAGLFDDDEARKAILDLRQRQEQSEARVKAAQAEVNAKLLEQIAQLNRSLLDLNNQLEVMRAEMAKLRGQDEQLTRDLEQITRDVVELQRQQKDSQQGVEDRIRKLEPQKVTLDGKEFLVDPEERRQFEESMAVLRKGDFAAASSAFSSFNRRYPGSGYNAAALFWLGNAQYGMRDYKEAM
ncbi:MAG: tol-pal system protein YbgF, partial [Rhizobacter sp.]